MKLAVSAAVAAHRTWMDAKAFFTKDDDEAMLEEAVREDKSAIDDYDNAMAKTIILHSIREIIKAQCEKLQNDLETSQILEDYR